MDAMRGTGAGLVPTPVDDRSISTNAVSLSVEQIYHDYAPRVYNMARRMVPQRCRCRRM